MNAAGDRRTKREAEFSNNACGSVLIRPNQLGVFGRPKSGLKDASVM